MTPHALFLAQQHRWHFILMEMQAAWSKRPPGGRLDYWGKQDLKDLGRKMVAMGETFIAEAERQEAERQDEAA